MPEAAALGHVAAVSHAVTSHAEANHAAASHAAAATAAVVAGHGGVGGGNPRVVAVVPAAAAAAAATAARAGVGDGGVRSTINKRRWTKHEHFLFLQGLELHGRDWKHISSLVETRNVKQVRAHAQKYFLKTAGAQLNGGHGQGTSPHSP
eukprot:jgi/Undpi1/4090/HiC_scaffold_16.g07457.m1